MPHFLFSFAFQSVQDAHVQPTRAPAEASTSPAVKEAARARFGSSDSCCNVVAASFADGKAAAELFPAELCCASPSPRGRLRPVIAESAASTPGGAAN